MRIFRSVPQPVATTVPTITALFWAIKVLTTGTGEALSDWLAGINLVLAAFVGLGSFALGMHLQFRAARYRPWTYWFAVTAVAIFGTMGADVLHKVLGVPYPISTAFYACVVAALFSTWYGVERTLSIHSIITIRREAFYWLTVLATFALGTAAGDWTAFSLNLGFLSSGLLFGALMLIPLIGWRLGLNPVVAFWFAYVITRPLGASFADWFAKDRSLGGLGLGDGVVAAIGLALIAVLVAVSARTDHADAQTVERVENEAAPSL